MTKSEKEFRKLFNRIDYSIKISNLFYEYENSHFDFNHKGRIYFKDNLNNKYCLILEKPIIDDYPKIEMRLYLCTDECFLIDYDNKIIHRGFYPSVGYSLIGNTFINAIDDYFKGLYRGYDIGLKTDESLMNNRRM